MHTKHDRNSKTGSGGTVGTAKRTQEEPTCIVCSGQHHYLLKLSHKMKRNEKKPQKLVVQRRTKPLPFGLVPVGPGTSPLLMKARLTC